MTIYFVQIAWIFMCAVVLKHSYKASTKRIEGTDVYLLLVFGFLGIVSAFRAPTLGTDTLTYYHMYERIANASSFQHAMSVSTISAPVYVFYAYVLSHIFSSPQAIIIGNTLIAICGFANYIKKNTTNIVYSSWLFIGLTLYYESMNGARQFIAIALVINAYIYLIEDIKSKKGWILVILAIGVHNTSVFFLLALVGLVMIKRKWSALKIFVVTISIGGVIGIVFTRLITVFLRYFPQYTMYVDGRNPASILNESGNGRIALLYLVLLSVDVLYLIGTYRKKEEIDPMFPGTVFGSVIGIIFSKNILVNRLVWYFLAFFIPLIPKTFQKYEKLTRWLLYVGYFGAIGVYCMFHLIEDKSRIVPYVMYFVSSIR